MQEPEIKPKSCCPIKPDLKKIALINNTTSRKMANAQKIKNMSNRSYGGKRIIVNNTLNIYGSYQGTPGGSKGPPRN